MLDLKVFVGYVHFENNRNLLWGFTNEVNAQLLCDNYSGSGH